MVLTRSSSSPQTRATTARCPHTHLSSNPSSSPTLSLRRRRLTLEAKHSVLYPITTNTLGIKGVKAEKRRLVQRGLARRLEVLSPRPPPSLLLPYDYQGHCLTGFVLRTGAKNHDLESAGAWVQPCTGCATCKGRKKRVFVHVPALPPHLLADAQLELWAMARYELYPIQRTPSASTSTSAALTADLSPSPSPEPSPTPSPLTLPDESTSIIAAHQSPSPPAADADLPSPLPSPLTADIPLQQSLNYYYGGYGAVEAHYSPAGEILVPTHDGNFHDRGRRSPSRGIVLDVCTPVMVCIWYSTPEGTVEFFWKLLHPRADESKSFRIGELVLADYREMLWEMGLPSGVRLERYLDSVDSWLSILWTHGIPIFGKNKVVFLRTVGLDVTPPDHFINLLPYL
ncbi:hypothetical protein B0H13DRAFT_2316658 [Mycena leptocephala]|nr:hypothetical protein B0H13DRAFT_2316658 [Mycena leptocephala]